jgi:protein arginine kinase
MIGGRFAKIAGEWLAPDGPDRDVVVSTRARLARNVEGWKMPWRLTDQERATLEAYLHERLHRLSGVDSTTYLNVDALDEVSRRLLVERHLISRELAQADGDRGVTFTPTESLSIMTNEEDHLRVQIIRAGFRVREAWVDIDALDDRISEVLDYAYSPSLGYLTACPTNLGTALRISVMAHLPTLVSTKQIKKIENAATQTGHILRGLYGEGTKPSGDLYQISNQLTLGRSEEEIVCSVIDLVSKIIEWERGVRSLLLAQDRTSMQDKVSGAIDALRDAEKLSFDEAMRHLSLVRLGITTNLAPNLSMQTVNELFLETQPAHLQTFHGAPGEPLERDRIRADFIRARLKSDNR